MEKIVITGVNHFYNDDFDELTIRVNHHTPQHTSAEVADDTHNAYLQLDPETSNVVGATIVYADDWFAEIAAAFQNKDVNNPEVVSFWNKKLGHGRKSINFVVK